MVKLNKIYTRTGDDGTTGLVDGSRVPKHDPRMAAIGDVDEANSAIGVAIAALGPGAAAQALIRIQNDLFDLGADLCVPGEGGDRLRLTDVPIARLEAEVEAMNARLSPLTSFILPGGSEAAARGLGTSRARGRACPEPRACEHIAPARRSGSSRPCPDSSTPG